MTALELALRLFGMVALGSVAVLMWRARRADHAARLGAALALSVGAFLMTSMPGSKVLLGVLAYPLSALCATHPVWFWLFCGALFADHRRFRRFHVLSLAGMALAGMVTVGALPLGWRAQAPGLTWWLGMAFGAASLAFVCLGPLTVHLAGRNDLDARRRRIRAWFVPVVSAYLALVVLVQLWAGMVAQPTPKPFVMLNLFVIDAVAFAVLLSFVQVRISNWLDLTEPAPDADALGALERSVLERLTRRFVPERLYAREALSIGALAELLGTQEHVLRRVINRGLGFRNFNDFLHSHRLREAAARLRDPAEARRPVLTIALEAGYASIGPFNRAFRERFEMTPTEYRRSAARADEPRAPAEPARVATPQ